MIGREYLSTWCDVAFINDIETPECFLILNNEEHVHDAIDLIKSFKQVKFLIIEQKNKTLSFILLSSSRDGFLLNTKYTLEKNRKDIKEFIQKPPKTNFRITVGTLEKGALAGLDPIWDYSVTVNQFYYMTHKQLDEFHPELNN